ncbi:MAG: PilN domain-containing protein [Pseudomonadota bacterium]
MATYSVSDGQLFGPSSFIGRFLRWWWAELRACVPQRLLAPRSGKHNELALIVHKGGTRLVQTGRSGKVRADLALDDDTAGSSKVQALAKRFSNAKSRTERAGLRLPEGGCFSRTFVVSPEAEADIRQIAAMELARKTPFKPAEIYWDCLTEPNRTAEGKLTVRQYVVKRDHAHKAFAPLEKLGVPLSFVDVCAGDDARPLGLNLLTGHQTEERPRAQRSLLKFAAVACCAALAAAVYLELDRKQRALNELNARTDVSRKQALAVRKKLESSSGTNRTVISLRRRKTETVPLIRTWSELTRVLPDTAFIEEVRVEPDKITIGGLAESAAELIGLIEGSPLFSGARFASQTLTDSQSDKERFNITFKLEEKDRLALAGQQEQARQ